MQHYLGALLCHGGKTALRIRVTGNVDRGLKSKIAVAKLTVWGRIITSRMS